MARRDRADRFSHESPRFRTVMIASKIVPFAIPFSSMSPVGDGARGSADKARKYIRPTVCLLGGSGKPEAQSEHRCRNSVRYGSPNVTCDTEVRKGCTRRSSAEVIVAVGTSRTGRRRAHGETVDEVLRAVARRPPANVVRDSKPISTAPAQVGCLSPPGMAGNHVLMTPRGRCRAYRPGWCGATRSRPHQTPPARQRHPYWRHQRRPGIAWTNRARSSSTTPNPNSRR